MLSRGERINKIIIKNTSKRRVRGIMGRMISFAFFLCSLICLEMAIGSPREQSVIKRLKVGRIRE